MRLFFFLLSPLPPPSLVSQAFAYVGTEITWVGEGVEEYGHVKGDAENVLVRVDPRYFRPTEVELLLVRDEAAQSCFTVFRFCFFVCVGRVKTHFGVFLAACSSCSSSPQPNILPRRSQPLVTVATAKFFVGTCC